MYETLSGTQLMCKPPAAPKKTLEEHMYRRG
jgi:hypothetical protein